MQGDSDSNGTIHWSVTPITVACNECGQHVLAFGKFGIRGNDLIGYPLSPSIRSALASIDPLSAAERPTITWRPQR